MCDPQWVVGRFVKTLKGRSSRLLRAEFLSLRSKLPTLWSNSYFVSTAGAAPLAMVKKYIENQLTSERPKESEKWARYQEGLSERADPNRDQDPQRAAERPAR